MKKLVAVLCTGFVLTHCVMRSGIAGETGEDQSLRFFRDLAETRSYTLGGPVRPVLTPAGDAVLFLRGGPRDPVQRLYEMNIATGVVSELLTPEAILKGAAEKLTPEERARRERMRMTMRGFTTFSLSEDGAQLLLTLSGRLYVVRRSDKRVTELPSSGWIDPSFSKDGLFVAAVREGELYVVEVANATERRLTTGATETLTHGLAEFAAEEEMDRHHGYWWSPDAKRIVYQETDVSMVEKHYIANALTPEEPPELFYYPRTGTANARVRLGIIDLAGGATTWVMWDNEKYPYLARVVWKNNAPLTILVQTRDQREEQLLAVDPASGTTRVLLAEQDPAWVNLDSDNDMPRWLEDGGAFIWSTERRGGWQLELRAADGAFLRELTPVGCECTKILDVDEKAGMIVTAGGPTPHDTDLYRVSMEGGEPERLTGGAGTHSATFSKDHGSYVYSFTLDDGRRGMEVRRADGETLAELPSVAEQPPFLPRVELTRVGENPVFNASIVRPRDFKAGRKYPVILSVYAGPGTTVVRGLPLAHLQNQWMADQGYIVVSLDGRGTPRRGRDWERVVKGNLIDIALDDQVAGLRALGAKYAEMDMSRVGVTGWSFGGYFAAMATIRRPDVFACGVAGAPVVDWADYDTHYTERYMDLPEANSDGYRKANVLAYAEQLERPLLLIHGITDDNVYFQHTLKLAGALFAARRHFELLPLLSTHMVPDPAMKLSLQTRIMDFFKKSLQP